MPVSVQSAWKAPSWPRPRWKQLISVTGPTRVALGSVAVRASGFTPSIIARSSRLHWYVVNALMYTARGLIVKRLRGGPGGSHAGRDWPIPSAPADPRRIVAAAAELLRSGHTPSMNDVAEAADVSRRTVYLYFPTLEQLLIDATLGMLSQSAVDEAIDAADTGGDVTERVAAMISALIRHVGRDASPRTLADPPHRRIACA